MKYSIQNILVGLLKNEPGWQILLDQIGVSWEVINFSNFNSNSYSVIIANKTPSDEEFIMINKYLSDGGSLITIYDTGKIFLNKSSLRKRVKSIQPLNNFPTYDILDVYEMGIFYDNEIVKSVQLDTGGMLIHLSFQINKIITSNEIKRKNFYYSTNRLPNEVVRLKSNFAIRRMITSILEFLHHRQNLPFIHKWFFPKDIPTVFTFRIDSDKGSKDEIDSLYSLSEKYDVPTTWFLDVKSHEEWLEYFKKFKKQEVAMHCYVHKTFDTIEENFNNFSKALTMLKEQGVQVSGLAAPRGQWNASVTKVSEKLKLSYSSEFSYDYDNFPSFPWIDNKFSDVLQLPVHPICPGSMRRAHFSSSDMIDYFEKYINKQISLREPIAIYHHPTHHYNDVIEKMFSYVNRNNILKLSYSQYAAWWEKRNSIKVGMKYDSGSNKIITTDFSNDKDLWFRISMPEKKEAIIDIKSRIFSMSSLDFKTYEVNYSPPADIFRSRMFDWRHIHHNILDFWYSRKT